MPIRRSPNAAHHPVHSLIAIARNGWSRSIGTTGRNQSEQVVAITRCAQPHQQKEAIARRNVGEPLVEIARSYAVSHSTISRLR
jgi:hypothetical protein